MPELSILSVILGATAVLLSAVGFFLRDIHRKFTKLVEEVAGLAHIVGSEQASGRVHRDAAIREANELRRRVERLEARVFGSSNQPTNP